MKIKKKITSDSHPGGLFAIIILGAGLLIIGIFIGLKLLLGNSQSYTIDKLMKVKYDENNEILLDSLTNKLSSNKKFTVKPIGISNVYYDIYLEPLLLPHEGLREHIHYKLINYDTKKLITENNLSNTTITDLIPIITNVLLESKTTYQLIIETSASDDVITLEANIKLKAYQTE
ncbi:MAG: hypothetical protein Q4G04_02430 [bacterium]|nr:hypothetical protein [bacterium]